MLSKLTVFIFICLLSLVLPELHAQSFYNWKRDRKLMIGLGLGTTNYYGDLNNTSQLLKFNPNLSLNVEYPASPKIKLRLELMHYQIAGDDSDYEGDNDPEGRYRRNLSFKSNNFELMTAATYSFFRENKNYYLREAVNPYALLGIGVTTVNPKALYEGEWYKLRGLETEGVDYNAFSMVIPFGVGARFKVSNSLNISLEGVYRITFTDYLDDVSSRYIAQSNFSANPIAGILADRRLELGLPPAPEGAIRGNPDRNDGYFTLSIKGSYYLPTSQWMRRMGSRRPKRLR